MKLKIFLSTVLFLVILGIYFYSKELLDISGLAQYNKYLDKFFIIIGGIIITYIISKIIDSTLKRIFIKIIKVDSLARKAFPLIHKILLIFVWLIGILFTLNLLNININTLIAGAGVGGVFLAFAGKEIASNLIGSLSLIFSKNFKIGDNICIKNYEGKVVEIDLSKTTIIDNNGNYVYIPNKNIVSEAIVNLSQMDYKKTEILVTIPSNTKINKFKNIIKFIEDFCKKEYKIGAIKSYEILIDSIVTTGQLLKIKITLDFDKDVTTIKNEFYIKIKEKLDK